MNGISDTNYLFIPYTYSAISAALNHGASTTVPLLLDQDADFELHEIFGSSSADDVATANGGMLAIRPNYFSVQISDKTNGRLWSDALLPQSIYARVPGGYKLYRPVLLARRSNLSIQFTNTTAATDAMVCRIYLLGAKVLQYNTAGAPR